VTEVAPSPSRAVAGAAARAPLIWRMATVVELVDETPHARTLVLDVPGWPGHAAGQHLDIRLTAEDGYVAERSYSIASAPEDARVALTVERIDDGEVSPYLAGELVVGDQFEVRGPVGGHFTWRAVDGGPLLLVGGGSGLVPLMAMLRHRSAVGSRADTRLLVSAREVSALLYREELERLGAAGDGLSITSTLTRGVPSPWEGFTRRVDAAMLEAVGPAAALRPRVFVCGPTPFVEAVADALVGLGHAAGLVHTERFGPTGG
jgi:ferredoxin-NADP reductase